MQHLRDAIHVVEAIYTPHKEWKELGGGHTHKILERCLAYRDLPTFIEEIWSAVLSHSHRDPWFIRSFRGKLFEEYDLLKPLFNPAISDMIPMARCFYLWSIYDMSIQCDFSQAFTTLVEEWIHVHGCAKTLAGIPIDVTDALQPITGKIGIAGGKSVLNRMIGEYGARSLTKEELLRVMLPLRPLRRS